MSPLKEKWTHAMGGKGRNLFNWVMKYHKNTILENMLRPKRVTAGLGDLPVQFTTNRVESINNLLKKETNGTLPINQCAAHIQNLVGRQHRNVARALIDRRPYKLDPKYAHFKVNINKWLTWSKVSNTFEVMFWPFSKKIFCLFS